MSSRGDRGRGRGSGRGDSRGGNAPRGGRGDFAPRGGRGDFAPRGGRGDFVLRGGRGDFAPRGDRGGFVPRGGRGDFAPRGDRGGFVPRGGRGRGGTGPAVVEVYSHGSGIPQPSETVQAVETATEQSLSLKSLKLDERTPMPHRPGYGTQGRPVRLWANYFELIPPKNLSLYRYNIAHGPDSRRGQVPVGKKVNWIIRLLLEQHFAEARDHIVTDYKSTMISKTDLGFGERELQIRYRPEGGEPSDPAVYHPMLLTKTGDLQLSELLDHLASTDMSAAYDDKNELIQALNIIAGFDAKSRPSILSIGANKHYPMEAGVEKASLGAGLEAFRGFMLSVRAATARILVNVQVKHAACYEAVPLGELIQSYSRDNKLDPTNSRDRHKLEKFLKLLRIEVTHIKRENKSGQVVPRVKTIQGLATPQDGRTLPTPPAVPTFGAGPNDVKFYLGRPDDSGEGGNPKPKAAPKGKKPAGKGPGATQSGEYISVAAFFRRTYNVVLQYTGLPVMNVGTRQNPSYLPVDVCVVQRAQQARTKITPSQTQHMMSFAVRKPLQNVMSITTNGPKVLGIGAQATANSTLERFNMSVTPNLITVPGRVLNGPNVQYKQGKNANTRFGSWNMQSNQFTTPTMIPTWSWLHISDGYGNFDLASALKDFQTELRNCGLNVPAPLPGRTINNAAELDSVFNSLDPAGNPQHPKLLLIILPRADTDLYNQIKCLGDIKKGIHTICVVISKFAKPRNEQYFANVALKFNLKLGGVNQSLNPSKLGILGEGKTMVVGLDVTHPSPGSADNAPSVAAIVASVDKMFGQWPADIRVQESRKEMVTDLQGMFESRLKLWRERNKGSLPENVVVYRDGVSEGQYDTVLREELPSIRKACEKIYPVTSTKNEIPRMSIIIVGKRHQTRFYPTKEADADRSSNPQNGTVVDRGVTEARNWDFFLQAHTAIKGTARPAHYFVVLDEIFRRRPAQAGLQNAADSLQDLTHNLCYLFGRATKAVSICPPAYYADLVCERARCYLSGIFDATPAASIAESEAGLGSEANPEDVRIHERLMDTMFYI